MKIALLFGSAGERSHTHQGLASDWNLSEYVAAVNKVVDLGHKTSPSVPSSGKHSYSCVLACWLVLGYHERAPLGFVSLGRCQALTCLLISCSQHWYPDHRSQRGGIFYPNRACPDTQIFLSSTQPWGKHGLTAFLVRAPGGLAQNLG